LINKTNKYETLNNFPRGKNILRYSEGGLRLNSVFKKNLPEKPLITIITVIFNGEKYFQETIDSIKKQTYKNYEFIVIDGGSKDKTIDIIKKNSNIIDYWISEDDKGLYDAFNKGLRLAKGEFVGIINSDDTYEANALELLIKYIGLYPKVDFIFGSVRKHWGILHGYKPKKIKYSWGFYSSHSSGFFIRNTSAKRVGFYNLKYKYHADYDYFYRMIVKEKMVGVATKKMEIFGNFRRGGFSSKANWLNLLKDEIMIRYDNGQNIFLIIFLLFYKLFFRIIKKIKELFNIKN
jgi:glycosyltransferase involved in cell wall biosynthesis